MVLPYPQDATLARVILPDARFRIIYAEEDWIFRLDDADKAILVFRNTIRPPFFLLLLIECQYASPEAQTNQLMAAADSEHRCRRVMNKISKAGEQFRFVIIEVAQGPAQNDSVGLKF